MEGAKRKLSKFNLFWKYILTLTLTLTLIIIKYDINSIRYH
jgi:hypothetical protein